MTFLHRNFIYNFSIIQNGLVTPNHAAMVVHARTTNRATGVSVPRNGQAGAVKRAQVSVYKAFFTSHFEEMVYKEIDSFDEFFTN